MGRIAGPLNPPVRLPSLGRILSTSMTIPRMVLMAQIASAPSDSQASATPAKSPASGLIFTQSGSLVAARTAAVTCAAHFRIATELDTTVSDVRTRDVEFDCRDPRFCIQTLRERNEVVDTGREHVGNHRNATLS